MIYFTLIDITFVAALYFSVADAVIVILYVPFLQPFFKVTFPVLLTVIYFDFPLVTLYVNLPLPLVFAFKENTTFFLFKLFAL